MYINIPTRESILLYDILENRYNTPVHWEYNARIVNTLSVTTRYVVRSTSKVS